MRPTAIIAEDEASQREALLELLREAWPELDVVARCEDGLEALEALQHHRPDFAFLDIRMPGLTGLAVALRAQTDTHFVFTTAHAEHAVAAFEQGAIDYLLKPLTRERLDCTVRRLQQLQRPQGDLSQALALARTAEGAARPLHWISATIGNTVRMIPLDEVLFFQSRDKYTRVVARNAEAIIRTPLKELLLALDPELFWRVHRSVIVRVPIVRAMHALGGERYELELEGTPERIPVSVAFKGRFRGM